jgi:hypothetical protein
MRHAQIQHITGTGTGTFIVRLIQIEIAAEVLPFRHRWVLERGTI